MNYYPFHIGDYVSATRHLSWDEDAAYRRLLDTYYTTEKPLPADIAKVCRLVLATTEAQREAVRTVLEEFFTLSDAGWLNSRADEELAAMREKVQATEEKDGHEKTRKERYRERRAFLFAFLRERDVVPPYDIGMKELQAEAAANGWDGTFKSVPSVPSHSETCVPCTVPPERSVDVHGDAPGTAIPTPTPTPTPKNKNPSGSTPPDKPARKPRAGRRVPEDFAVTADMQAWAADKTPLVDWVRETEKFRDWEFQHARTDWPATWRTWMRKAQETSESKGAGGRVGAGQQESFV